MDERDVEEPEQESLTAAEIEEERQQEIEFDIFVTRASKELEACRAIVSRPMITHNQLILLHVWKQLEQITDHSLNLLAVEYAGRGRRACAVGVAGLR